MVSVPTCCCVFFLSLPYRYSVWFTFTSGCGRKLTEKNVANIKTDHKTIRDTCLIEIMLFSQVFFQAFLINHWCALDVLLSPFGMSFHHTRPNWLITYLSGNLSINNSLQIFFNRQRAPGNIFTGEEGGVYLRIE